MLKIYLIVCWKEDLNSYNMVYLDCLEVAYIKCATLNTFQANIFITGLFRG